MQELASLLYPTNAEQPKLPPDYPFSNVLASSFWSTTIYASDTGLAWHVNFDSGAVNPGAQFGLFLGWCVRGGQGGPDAQ